MRVIELISESHRSGGLDHGKAIIDQRDQAQAIRTVQVGPPHARSDPRDPEDQVVAPVGAPSEAMKDKMAEKAMNPHGYSKKRNPICPRCYIQMSNVGCTNCV